jgi:hypothetical protein
MRALTTALPASELSEMLGLPRSIIDTLIEQGALLCVVREGEARVPLAQVEALFRETLLRVYRAEALHARTETVLDAAEASPAPEPSPNEQVVVEESTPAGQAISVVSPPAPERFEEPVRPEQRIAPRYVPLRQLSGIFGDTKFTVLQLSATGLRIRHDTPLIPGDEAKVSFALMRPARSVVVRARVVWTSLARSGDQHFSISGLRVLEHAERLRVAIETLESAHELQRERRARGRRDADGIRELSGLTDEEIALVTNAMRRFADDPIEASRWYSRARFALADEEIRRLAPRQPRDRDEVLGIWEYLERPLDLTKVAGVVNWARG